ncbi:TonB-dependent receptor [Microbulbifer salipaludis]|uniref:TonB-dependent receptor n=1 Tax=Microbulbifer salipaludis TaxID=187980 RepID=A0ABS3E2A4_9GAMM|nr:TonB-dependent receptor [Microbulbifer salipaludis]MBN8429423.1 TonB-dependent receptor [Microbulbifer salipaludis]
MMMRYKTLAAAIALSNLAYGAAALAQAEDTDKVEDRLDDSALEQVIVTATKRETNLMDTPIAISAFSEETLDKLGVKNIKDLNNLVPNMSIMVDNESSAPIITMRGVRSTNTTEWGDPAVGVHFDGIYTPRPQGAMALMFDIERAEMLRGPQGTLFGRNSTVGSINIISAKPKTDEFEASTRFEAGRFNQRAFKGMINIPVSDTFALRAAYMTEKKDSNLTGYYDPNQWDQRYLPMDELTPTDSAVSPAANGFEAWLFDQQYYQEVKADPADFYNNANQWAARVSASWTPTEKASWLVTVERFRDDSAGGIGQRDCERIEDRPVEMGGTCTDIWGSEDNFVAYVNVPGKNDMTMDSVRSHFTYDISDELQFVYNAGYQNQERTGQYDIDQGYYAWDQMLKWVDTDYDSWSHELQLKSTGDGRLQWIAGYFNFKEDNYMNGHYQGAMGGASLWIQPERVIKSEAVFGQATYSVTEQTHLTLGLRHTEDSKEDIGGRNWGCWDACSGPINAWGFVDWGLPWGNPDAWFGDGTAQTPRNTLNALPADYYDQPREGFVIDTQNDVYESWSKTTWRIGIDHDLSDNTMVYGYVANGYKGGGIGDVLYKQSTISPENPTGDRFDTSYDGETVVTYEVGVKTSLLDGDMNLRANYFYNDYKDQQFSTWTIYDVTFTYEPARDDVGEPIFDANGDPVLEEVRKDHGTFLTRNAASSRIQGLELEMEWAPWAGGHIGGYVTFLDTEITSDYWKQWGSEPGQVFNNDANPSDSSFGNSSDYYDPRYPSYRNLKGNELAYSPNASLTVNMSHTFEFRDGSSLTPFLSVHWEDDAYLDIDNRDKWVIPEEDMREGVDIAWFTDKRDAWTMATANLNYTSASQDWYAEAWVYNLTDEDVNWWQGFGGSTPMAGKAQRSYGLSFGYHW